MKDLTAATNLLFQLPPYTHVCTNTHTEFNGKFLQVRCAFPCHLCPATSLPAFWVCTWPQRVVALSCCFKKEEDQAAALWAMPPSQDCLEALRHPSSFNLPALDRPSQRPGPRSSGSVSCCHLAEELSWWLRATGLVQVILRESFQVHY